MGIDDVWEENYDPIINGSVCSGCFTDYGIKKFIENNINTNQCSYCDSENLETKACDFKDVVVHIIESIKYEWGHPSNEGLFWEYRSGWLGGEVYDTYDLIYEILTIDVKNEEILSDLNEAIVIEQWCKKNPHSFDENKRLIYAWKDFTQLVKYNSRYLFLRKEDSESLYNEMNPVKILDSLGKIIHRLDLTTTLGTDQKIFRVRVTDIGKLFSTAKELGSPPKKYATISNRMSPAGISMFYGAFDIETAISETYEKEEIVTKYAVFGIFNPARTLTVIDLSEKIIIPSLFDEGKRENRYFLKFLQDFIIDFSKPIKRIDSSHINYVPTQIVTEYFKHIYKQTEFGEKIDGIIYPSSKESSDKCIVIFADSDQCINVADRRNGNEILILNETGIENLTSDCG